MGYAGLKISGHSGTEFKHRKGFEKIKKLNQHTSRTKNGENEIDENSKQLIQKDLNTRFEHAEKYHRLKMIIGIPILIISALLFSYIIFKGKIDLRISQYATNAYEERISKEKKQNDEFYRTMISEGNYHLENEKITRAQNSFKSALAMDRYGEEANIGMTKAVIQECISDNRNCQYAIAHLQFVKLKKFKGYDKLLVFEKEIEEHLFENRKNHYSYNY